MEMGDDEIGVMPVDIERLGGHRDAGHSAEGEEEQEAEEIEHWGIEMYGTFIERRRPGEDFDGREDADEHGQDAEDPGVELGHPGHEHVVAPGEKTDEGD